MADIYINLDEPVFSPSVDMTLLELVKAGNFEWPTGASCLTQESDGELCWWSAPLEQVRAARVKASRETGLMPLLGLKHCVNADYFSIEGQDYVAKNWETAVVSLDQFVNLTDAG